MKILYIANRAEIFSGGQISLLELISRIDRSRFKPIILCPGEGALTEKMRQIGVEVRIWDMPTARTLNVFRIIKKARDLKNIIKSAGADIVHTNGSRAQLYAAIALKNSKTVLLWHVRESIKDMFLYDLFLAKASDKIICVSKAVKEKRFGLYSGIKDKIEVIYNGVDTNKFNRDEVAREVVREELGIDADTSLVGMLGILVPLKGHTIMLRAFKRICKNHPKAKLLIAGKIVDESYREQLERLVRDLKLTDRVIFAGERSDVNAILSALDIFVLPSEREGFSRALLEAMSCSVPIIATEVGGNIEAIVEGETGLLVDYGNVVTLANAVTYILNDPDRAKRIGISARKRAVDLFSITKHVSEIEELYSTLEEKR